MKRAISLLLIGLVGFLGGLAQEHQYRLWLTDKGDSPYSIERPEEFLSQAAIDRRAQHRIAIDSTDLPISTERLKQIARQGARILTCSKWLNTVTIAADSTAFASTVTLPFIEKHESLGSVDLSNKETMKPLQLPPDTVTPYGEAYWQIALHNGDKLHQAGFTGEGITIAVVDGGFLHADRNPMFNQEQIVGVHDFVEGEMDFAGGNAHGSSVLSTMLVNQNDSFIGTAPDADYWLLRSEDTRAEYPAEEDYWAAAVEFADSVGIKLITTSLGYVRFDTSKFNYLSSELDGKTAFISRAAAKGVEKGLLLVISAGNEGGNAWRKITVPGDVDGALTVGAVTPELAPASFSGQGYTADNRVKPDVVGLGSSVAIIGPDGNATLGSGTSFATPIVAGLTACLWQAFPHLSAQEVIDLIRRNSSQYHTPDAQMGYGIPDFYAAYRQGVGIKETQLPDSPLHVSYLHGKPQVCIKELPADETHILLRLYNTKGKLVQTFHVQEGTVIPLRSLHRGIYLLVAQGKTNYWTQKLQYP